MVNSINNFLSSRRNNPALRNPVKYKIQEVKAIIIHWTSSTGYNAKAENVIRYWNNTNRYGSAHYIVDEEKIINTIPETDIAYHVGGKNYTDLALDLMDPYMTPNYVCLGIEMCFYKNNNHEITTNTTAKLCADLIVKYDLETNDIFRHFDITGKKCPQFKRNSSYSLMTDQELEDFRHLVGLYYLDYD